MIEQAIQVSENMSFLDKFFMVSIFGGEDWFSWFILSTILSISSALVCLLCGYKMKVSKDKEVKQIFGKLFILALSFAILGVAGELLSVQSGKLVQPIELGYHELLAGKFANNDTLRVTNQVFATSDDGNVINLDIILDNEVLHNQLILKVTDQNDLWTKSGFYKVNTDSFSKQETEFLKTAFKVKQVKRGLASLELKDIDYLYVIK